MSDITTVPVPPLLLEPGLLGSRVLLLTRSLSDEEKGYEVIGGRLTPKLRSVYDTVVANDHLNALADHDRADRSGHLGFGMLFDLPGVENFWRPEVAFVPYSVWPRARPLPRGEAWSVVPELVAEIHGVSTREADLAARIPDYFGAGVRAVWVVRTRSKEVHCFNSPDTARVLTLADELTGNPVVPGFRMPVADLFPPSDPAP